MLTRFLAVSFGVVSAAFYGVFATVGYIAGSAREGFSLGY